MTESVNIWKHATAINLEAMNDPNDYVMEDPDLRAAANAALILGKPLLLTGEAGVGKSQFASWLAKELQLGQPLKFVVKSTTDARELFYQYDTLARFHEAQVAHLEQLSERDRTEGHSHTSATTTIDPRRYLTFNALGKAILFSLGKPKALEMGLVSEAMDRLMTDFPDEPRRSVVLVDEIDKAPRDVPNDMLDEIEHLSFTIRELRNRTVAVNKDLRPVVVMTSNSERDLPKPFLRRCVFYNMKFPEDPAMLARIVEQRVGKRFHTPSTVPGQAIMLFGYLREHVGLRQKPGLAELLDFLASVAEASAPLASLKDLGHLQATVKATLLKDKHDQEQCDRDWPRWREQTLGT